MKSFNVIFVMDLVGYYRKKETLSHVLAKKSYGEQLLKPE
ncbi:uncharacterized protein METZ01_LOCUS457331 [marine metagenome]|jgi:hypothetical protein|uniref:Uncharacterized protein n=1 Tax=marine metagenome TaxID=408172 RepID=A0A383A9J0_9ZZZZ|tara:strand:+ start:2450 stop:2569 length:120 start_codon:yes stop_codon:yes gene_type:complete